MFALLKGNMFVSVQHFSIVCDVCKGTDLEVIEHVCQFPQGFHVQQLRLAQERLVVTPNSVQRI